MSESANTPKRLLPRIPTLAWAWLVVLLTIALMLPRPLGNVDAPSSKRALETIESIAAKPHPMGSAEHARVRDYLVNELAQIGANPVIHQATVVYDHPRRGKNPPRLAQVDNIIGRLGSAEGAPALLLMSHYDTQAFTPGAADASTGVAAVLEAARALSEIDLKREIIVLLTDGEEFGLFGAQAFFRQHPLAESVGLVLNFEARGSAGPVYMFETDAGNGSLIEEFRAAVGRPNANSMAYEIYQRMPNNTDFTIARQAEVPGLNFAFIDGFPDYHSATDTPQNIDASSVAEMVAAAIESAVHFATVAELPKPTESATYFEVIPGWSVQYSGTFATAIGIAAIVVALLWLARQRHARLVGIRALAWSMVAGITVILVISNLWESLADGLALNGYGSGAGREWILQRHLLLLAGYCITTAVIWTALTSHWITQRMTLAPYWIVATILVVLSAIGDRLLAGFLVSAAFLAMAPYVRSRVTQRSLAAGGIALWSLITAVVIWLMPQGAYLFAWPLLMHVLASWRQSEPPWKSVVAFALTLILWVPIVYSAYLGVGIWMPQFIAVTCALLLWLGVGVLAPVPSSRWSSIMFVTGGSLILWALAVNPFDARRPTPDGLYAVEYSDSAFWVLSRNSAWLQSAFPRTRTIPVTPWQPRSERSVLVAERDKSVTMPARLEGEYVDGRWQGVLVNSDGAEVVSLYFSADAAPTNLVIDGQDVSVGQATDGWYRVRWYAPRHDTAVGFSAQESGRVVIVSRHFGMPDGAPERPPTSMPPRYSMSDSLWQVTELVMPGEASP